MSNTVYTVYLNYNRWVDCARSPERIYGNINTERDAIKFAWIMAESLDANSTDTIDVVRHWTGPTGIRRAAPIWSAKIRDGKIFDQHV